jgi:hypothetical protein
MGTGRSACESDMDGAGDDDGDGHLLSRCVTVKGEVEMFN